MTSRYPSPDSGLGSGSSAPAGGEPGGTRRADTSPYPPAGTSGTRPLPEGGVQTRAAVPPGVGLQAVRQPIYGLGMIVSLVVAGIVFILAFWIIGDGDREKMPLAQTTNVFFWIVATATIVGAGIGAQFAERTAAEAAAAVGRPRLDTALATAWTVPIVATFAAIMLVATYHNGIMLLAGPAIAFFGNAGALLSRDLLDDAADATQRTATTIHTLVVHAVAFLALSAIYLNKMPTWVAAPLVGIAAGLLILETLERGTAPRHQRILYAVFGGAAVAEAMVALNWWQTYNWTGGAVLLVCFYLAAGVLLARTQRSVLRGRDLIEFGLVSAVAFAVLAITA